MGRRLPARVLLPLMNVVVAGMRAEVMVGREWVGSIDEVRGCPEHVLPVVMAVLAHAATAPNQTRPHHATPTAWAGAESDAEDEMGGVEVQLRHVEGEVLLHLHPRRHGLRSAPPPAQDGVVHVHSHLDVRLSAVLQGRLEVQQLKAGDAGDPDGEGACLRVPLEAHHQLASHAHLLVRGCLLQVEGEEAGVDVGGEAGTHPNRGEVDGTVSHHHAAPAARHLTHGEPEGGVGEARGAGRMGEGGVEDCCVRGGYPGSGEPYPLLRQQHRLSVGGHGVRAEAVGQLVGRVEEEVQEARPDGVA